jgi:hypothetical protein
MKIYCYRIGTGWMGTFTIRARSMETALRRIQREWELESTSSVHIWEK